MPLPLLGPPPVYPYNPTHSVRVCFLLVSLDDVLLLIIFFHFFSHQIYFPFLTDTSIKIMAGEAGIGPAMLILGIPFSPLQFFF